MTYLSVMWISPPSNGMSPLMIFAIFPKPDEILSSDEACSRVVMERESHRLTEPVLLLEPVLLAASSGLLSATTALPLPPSKGSSSAVSMARPGRDWLACIKLVSSFAAWYLAARRSLGEIARSFSDAGLEAESEGAKIVLTWPEVYRVNSSGSDRTKVANCSAPDAARASKRLGRGWAAAKVARRNTVAQDCESILAVIKFCV